MVGAEQPEEYAEAFTTLISRHPDASLSVAEAILARRPELSKAKKTVLAACQAAKSAASVPTGGSGHDAGSDSGVFTLISATKAELAKRPGAVASAMALSLGSAIQRRFN